MFVDNIQDGFITAFIDKEHSSNLAYKPQFLSNNYQSGHKVLTTIERELNECTEFCISVAFITESGITPLLQVLKELEIRNVPGKILTTDYLTFSDPKALRTLASLKNIELKMYVSSNDEGFHTKGYIFKKANAYNIIIGSSNLTQSALTINKEWNTKIVSTEFGEMSTQIISEFNDLWNSEHSLPFEKFIDNYSKAYDIKKKQRELANQEFKDRDIANLDMYRLTPNSMQANFCSNLQKLINAGESRALLISATGTGKTYASAFGTREIGFNRMLFIVHREQIAKQAMDSYSTVFGSSKSYGLLSGNSKDYSQDVLFSTMQTMSKDEYLHSFNPNAFDIIVIDEVHHAAANSYIKIMNYFKPKLWLGMTATPDRRVNDGDDIYSIFNHNIAYEIRLQQALEEFLLCPFHYFGITDLELDDMISSDSVSKSLDLKQFNYLTSDTRVEYIIEKTSYYGYSGNRVKGLMFCSRKEVGEELSHKFNERGLRTLFLSGDDSQDAREEAIDRLTSDERDDYLDYIITVDIFNEGVDIPEINQVVMLRPTQSPIIFVQQLGRGLRKRPNKEFVVIIDFIGNYKNNFMIPIALSGDRTYNKDNVRRYVVEGEKIIPGSSTIHFDSISRKRIFESIDAANFSDLKLIKDNYLNLKYKLGRIPSLIDFDNYGEMDVLRIFDNNSLRSYYTFLVKYEKDYLYRLTENEALFVEFISRKLASGKRIHELLLLDMLLNNSNIPISQYISRLSNKFGITIDQKELINVFNVMTNEFPSGSNKRTYENCIFIEQNDDGNWSVSNQFKECLSNTAFYNIVRELIDFGIHRYKRDYSNQYKETRFVLYKKYTYEDVCRLLSWQHNEVSLNIGGYKYDSWSKTFPIFINYDKADNIQDTVKYEDHFVSPDKLIAISKSNRSINSDDVQNFIHAKERGIRVELFVRKNKDDAISKEFYYLGGVTATGNVKEFIMENTTPSAVEIEWILDQPVREDLYEYIVNG